MSGSSPSAVGAESSSQVEIRRLQYHLDRNIDPETISGPIFARGFANAEPLRR